MVPRIFSILLHFGADYANVYDFVVETARKREERRYHKVRYFPHSMEIEPTRAENHTEVASNRISIIT